MDLRDMIRSYTVHHALLIWACQSPMWCENYESQEDTIQWLECLTRLEFVFESFDSFECVVLIFLKRIWQRTTFCPRHCLLFATWASPTSRVPGGKSGHAKELETGKPTENEKWKMHKNMEKNTRRKCIQMLQMQVCWGIRDLECLQLVLSRPPSLSPAEFLDSPKVVRCSFPSEPFCFAVSHRFTTFPSPGSIELIWRLNLKLQLHPMASFWANAQGSNESRIMFRYFYHFTCLYIILYVFCLFCM